MPIWVNEIQKVREKNGVREKEKETGGGGVEKKHGYKRLEVQ